MPTFECPIRRKLVTVSRKVDAPFRPLCSSRCKLVDLGRWLDGIYRVSELASPEETRSQGLPETEQFDDDHDARR